MKLLVSLGLFTHFRMLVLVARFDFCDCFFHVLGWMSEEGSILACPSLIPFFSPAVPSVTSSSMGTVLLFPLTWFTPRLLFFASDLFPSRCGRPSHQQRGVQGSHREAPSDAPRSKPTPSRLQEHHKAI